MKNDSKATADQEAICQALEQLQDSMEIIQQIISRLRRSVHQAQSNLNTQVSTQQNHKNQVKRHKIIRMPDIAHLSIFLTKENFD